MLYKVPTILPNTNQIRNPYHKWYSILVVMVAPWWLATRTHPDLQSPPNGNYSFDRTFLHPIPRYIVQSLVLNLQRNILVLEQVLVIQLAIIGYSPGRDHLFPPIDIVECRHSMLVQYNLLHCTFQCIWTAIPGPMSVCEYRKCNSIQVVVEFQS